MIRPLTSLRFIFALMVFFHHLSFVTEGDSLVLHWFYKNVFSEGFIGVNFFFILSGFVLAYNYQDKFQRKMIPKRKFFVARFARIYPLHFLTLMLAIPLMLKKLWVGNKIFWVIKLFANLTLTHSFIPKAGVYLSFNRPAWSISDEAFFYLIFPFLILLIARKVESNWKIIYWILFGLVIIPILMFIVPAELQHALFYVNPVFRLADFVLGILLFNFYKKMKDEQIDWNFTLLEVAAVGTLVVFFLGHFWVPEIFRYSIYYWLPMSLVIFIFAFQGGFISKVLSHSTLVWLGEISFAFYMFHHLVLDYFEIANSKFFHLSNEFLLILIVLILTLLISHFSFIKYEKPMNIYLRKKYETKIDLKK